jgi:tripartite-type tricarboxylate transporter receptor subunit TctC
VTLNSFFTTPLRQEDLGIDIQTFTPVAMMGVDPFVLWVHTESAASPPSTSSSRQVQAMDGEFVMGGTGSGQEDSIVIAYMSGAYDLDINYIPYDGGGAVARDLAGQQIMATVNNPAEAKGFYEAGDFVPLLAFSDERMPAYPDVPTIMETGPRLLLLQPAGRGRCAGHVGRGRGLLHRTSSRGSTRATSGRPISNPKAFRRCGWTPTRSAPTGRRRSKTTGSCLPALGE